MNVQSREKIKIFFPLFGAGIIMLILLHRINLLPGSDDIISGEKVLQMGLFQWIKFRVINWQPRIISDFFFGSFVQVPIGLWRIINSIVFILLLFIIGQLSAIRGTKENLKEAFWFVFLVFFYLPPFVITSSVLWFTGSFYYLWQTMFMLFALFPLVLCFELKDVDNNLIRIVINIVTIFACYTEQTAAVLFCFFSLSIIYLKTKKLKVNKTVWMQYVLIIINIILFVVLTQFGDRISKEKHWYIGFDMLSSVDKFFQGINWTNFHYINSGNLLMLILIILATILVWNSNKHIFVKIYASTICMFWSIRIIPLDIIFKNVNLNNDYIRTWVSRNKNGTYYLEELLNNIFYNTNKANPQNLLSNSWGNLLPSFFGIVFILLVVGLIYVALERGTDRFIYSLLYLAALSSGYAISFSPTIYASGSRVFFLGDVLILLITTRLFIEITYKGIKFVKHWKYIFGIIMFLIWLELFFKFSSQPLWL
ncbi:hypothetical protein EII17_03780 [Clostridiales bacterium COT073_COT-073]|nr:hypothetical protein EII17_03780 [Clostridiales bacterium COT073_COT-073]